jgi:nitrite reductase/ring-hydroxylating ferredoxin subunit
MKKMVKLGLVLAVLGVFAIGCSGYVSKETKVKCPKCGAVFTIDEGLKTLEKTTSP